MHNVSTEGAHSAATPTTTDNLTDYAQRQALFTRNYAAIADAASAPGLSAITSDDLIRATADHLHRYPGPDSDAEFQAWITEHVRPAAERLAAYFQMRVDHRKIVLAGIWSVIRGCGDLGADLGESGSPLRRPRLKQATDGKSHSKPKRKPIHASSPVRREPGSPSVTVSDLENDTWVYVFLHLEEFTAPGVPKVEGGRPPKLSTRLYAAARFQAMGWRTDRLRDRARFVNNEDAAKVERLSFDKEHGYGRYYPKSMRPRPALSRENLLPVVTGDAPLFDAM
jgi:hypothetical protein